MPTIYSTICNETQETEYYAEDTKDKKVPNISVFKSI